MCLLERVSQWDAQRIECVALSHRDVGNPLRTVTGLPAWAGIEYAAQAAAVHGALTQGHTEPRNGVLAAVRNVTAAVARLDLIDSELRIGAEALHQDAAGAIYRFEIMSGERLLLNGQFTLMFRPAGRST
jgi:predicted hotdog family 3-hydroxylacyl-ACP dehydratase